MSLLGKIQSKDKQIEKCENFVNNLSKLYVDHIRDLGKENITITVQKYTASAIDKYHDLLYYISRTQGRKRYVKLKSINQHFPDHEVIVELYRLNSIHAFT